MTTQPAVYNGRGADSGNNCHTSHVSGLAEPCYPGEEEEEEGVKDLHVSGLARINSVCCVQTN